MAQDQNQGGRRHESRAEAPPQRTSSSFPGSTLTAAFDARVFDLLLDACLSSSRDDGETAISSALAMGQSAEQIADVYLPALARHLGQGWCEDQVSFAKVTIGVSRLQSMLRLLGPEWNADLTGLPAAESILVATPPRCYHTFGALLLTGQLRRRGYSVKLILDADGPLIADLVQRSSFGAIFLSGTESGMLESLRKIVDFVGSELPDAPPIVLGGAILDAEPEAGRLTGADHATSDLDEALSACGIATRTSPRHTAEQGR